GAGRPEPLARVVQVPGVEVADLRALERHDPAELPGPQRPGPTGPNGHHDPLDGRPAGSRLGQAGVEGAVDRQAGGRIVRIDVEPVSHRALLTISLNRASAEGGPGR